MRGAGCSWVERRPDARTCPTTTRRFACAWATDGDLIALAYRLGRSPDALRLHARHLGLHRPPPRRRWAEWEDAVIRDGYTSALPYAEIARQLPHRTTTSLAARARKLGLISYARRWSITRRPAPDAADSPREHARGRRLSASVGPRRRSAGAHRGSGSSRPPRRRRPATLGGGPGRRTSCCACTTRSTRPASPSCSDAQTPPSADDCARSDCAPAPSAPPTIRATDRSPRAATRRAAQAMPERNRIAPTGPIQAGTVREGCRPGRGRDAHVRQRRSMIFVLRRLDFGLLWAR